MSLFEDNTKIVPITAQSLRNLIHARYVYRDTAWIERYNKILQRLQTVVEHSIETDVWEYEISLAAIGCYDGNPFTHDYTRKINELITQKKKTGEIVEWVRENKREYDDEFSKFLQFMKNRGFKIIFKIRDFLLSSDRLNDKLVVVSWKEEE